MEYKSPNNGHEWKRTKKVNQVHILFDGQSIGDGAGEQRQLPTIRESVR